MPEKKRVSLTVSPKLFALLTRRAEQLGVKPTTLACYLVADGLNDSSDIATYTPEAAEYDALVDYRHDEMIRSGEVM